MPTAENDSPRSPHPLWVRASVEDAAFAHEQARLARMWNFIGMTSDVPRDNDWFRTTLGMRSIFVQRFGAEIRAFENRCAHRFYPLRTADAGNGPVLCAFHHWRYNKDGVALGIPNCPDMYGAIPRELNARLPRLDVAICGDLIFARYPGEAPGESLEDFLGEAYPVIAAMGMPRETPYRYTQDVKSYWKFSHHISLDDYHIVAVHPTTFGKDGHLNPDFVNYYRFGRSSAFLETTTPEALSVMARECAAGTYRPGYYAILNMFPNSLISQFHATKLFGAHHWYVAATRYLPVSRDTTKVHVWLYRAPFPQAETRLSRLARPVTDRIVPPIVAHYAKKVMGEDNAIVEGQQAHAQGVEGQQLLAASERRIGWYEEAYAEVLGDAGAAAAARRTIARFAERDATQVERMRAITVGAPPAVASDEARQAAE